MGFKLDRNRPNKDMPGVYPDIEGGKGVGKKSSNLKEFSLGNWNSITKNNKKFMRLPSSEDLNTLLGRPVRVFLTGMGLSDSEIKFMNFPIEWCVIDTTTQKVTDVVYIPPRDTDSNSGPAISDTINTGPMFAADGAQGLLSGEFYGWRNADVDGSRNDIDNPRLPFSALINHKMLGFKDENDDWEHPNGDYIIPGGEDQINNKVIEQIGGSNNYHFHFIGASSDNYWLNYRNGWSDGSAFFVNNSANPMVGMFKTQQAVEDVKNGLYEKMNQLRALLNNAIGYLSYDIESEGPYNASFTRGGGPVVGLKFGNEINNQLNEILKPVEADFVSIDQKQFDHYVGANFDVPTGYVDVDGVEKRVFEDYGNRYKHQFRIPFFYLNQALDFYGEYGYDDDSLTNQEGETTGYGNALLRQGKSSFISLYSPGEGSPGDPFGSIYNLGQVSNITGGRIGDIKLNFPYRNQTTYGTNAGRAHDGKYGLSFGSPLVDIQEEVVLDSIGRSSINYYQIIDNEKIDITKNNPGTIGTILTSNSSTRWDNINITEIHFIEDIRAEAGSEYPTIFGDGHMYDYLGVNNNFQLTFPTVDSVEIEEPEAINYAVSVFYNEEDIDTIPVADFPNTSDKNFIYYGKNDDRYSLSSFPARVFLGIDIHSAFPIRPLNRDSFDNAPVESSLFEDIFYRENVSDIFNTYFQDSALAENGYYRYEVLQWGDEEVLLTDEQILESPYFINYDRDVSPDETNNDWFLKIHDRQQKKSLPIIENGQMILSSHIYNSPGVKPIKIIIYRYALGGVLLNETTLVTKNIVINDANLQAEDFEIFGGTQYNFLPSNRNQIIVGGLEEDSKFIKSSRKIKNENLYGRDNFLEKSTTNNFIKDYSNGLFGKSPDKMDIGNIRTLKGVHPMSHMVGNFHTTGSMGDNTLISNIFIDKIDNDMKRDTILELNPEKKDFITIRNTVGTKDVAILIGDYELEKKKIENPIRKKGFMNTSQIDTNKDKQAI